MTTDAQAQDAKETVQVRGRWRYRILTSLISAGVLSTFIAAVTTLVRVGPDGFRDAFLSGWPIGFATAFPASLIVVPFVQKLVDRVFGLHPPE